MSSFHWNCSSQTRDFFCGKHPCSGNIFWVQVLSSTNDLPQKRFIFARICTPKQLMAGKKKRHLEFEFLRIIQTELIIKGSLYCLHLFVSPMCRILISQSPPSHVIQLSVKDVCVPTAQGQVPTRRGREKVGGCKSHRN